ncbi:MAG: chemotaxis protein CheA [Lachnospiraceae bacterium]|nr:chemotaxis protein CheA [Lachnospiraceae bacterium]
MDVSQYLDIFIDETREHIQNLNTQILILEQDPENMDTINEIFRAAHSLKGMAGTMGYKRMQNLNHDMENVFSEVRNNNIRVTPDIIDVIFQCIDALEDYLIYIQETADEGTDDNAPLIKALNDILASKDGVVETVEEASADVSENEEVFYAEKWRGIPLSQQDCSLIAEASSQNIVAYGISVYVQETCILKAARAFLVFKTLEELGEILVSSPTAQEIEDEHFEFDFSMVFLSEHPLDKIIAAIKNVSEIADAIGSKIDLDDVEITPDEERHDDLEEEEEEEEELVSAPVVQTTNTPNMTEASKEVVTAPARNTGKKQVGKPVVNRTVRVDIEKLDVLMNLVSELIISKNSLVSAAASEVGAINLAFNEQIEYLESVTTNLHESVMKVRMVPIESVVSKFPRMIRDLSKTLDKKMELYMSGEETELDRTVVDEIGDPLMHLLRNSADHGLETAEVRLQRGKPEVGSIFLDAYQDGNNVVIEVSDDGNGIDVEAVKAKAIERAIITPEQSEIMTDKEIIDLLFLPSFSTAKQVSDVSGRGVGLDVVKSKIEALSGEIETRTTLGKGSTFIIRLPLTLAIIQALMVVVGTEKYAISLGSIQTIENIPVSEIKTVQGKEVIHLRGVVIPLVRLNTILDVESTSKPDEDLVVLIAKKGDRLAGLVVDELIGQMEIVIKSMGKFVGKCKLISGATILGDGEVALILDANALI